jgi:uncharacterized lipoprotein YddW (UPF0748 family)
MKKILIISLLLQLFVAGVLFSKESPKREFRGAWFPTVVNTTWKNMTTDQIKEDIVFYLDLFKSLNMNAVIFQVRPQADALFVSELEPWSRFLTGEQGQEPVPFFDPAKFVIEECHKRGMEMHAWFNPYRVTSSSNEVLAKEHLYFQKPYLFVHYGNQIYFDPGHPESREHTVKVVEDFVRRYDADAIHFDDYFYPYRVPYREFPDERSFELFREQTGHGPFQKDDWRRNNVDILVKELNEAIKAIKPWVKFGISPFGVWRNDFMDPMGSQSSSLQTNYDDLFADILKWTREKWIDYNAPQLYWEIGHKRVDYSNLTKWWSKNRNGVNLYIGQSIWNQLEIKNYNGDVVNQLHRKMAIVRNNDSINGNIWWSGLGLASQPKLIDSLKGNYQKHIALMPSYSHIDSLPPLPVKNLKYKRGLLSWRGQNNCNPMDDPYFFVVYKFGKNESVDIDNPKAIIAVVKDDFIKVKRKRGETVVVTVLDRCQNESVPTSISF